MFKINVFLYKTHFFTKTWNTPTKVHPSGISPNLHTSLSLHTKIIDLAPMIPELGQFYNCSSAGVERERDFAANTPSLHTKKHCSTCYISRDIPVTYIFSAILTVSLKPVNRSSSKSVQYFPRSYLEQTWLNWLIFDPWKWLTKEIYIYIYVSSQYSYESN